MFADNSKYFFLHVHEAHKNIRIVWLARDRALATILTEAGYEAYCIHSIKGVFYALKAQYTIIDAYLENIIFYGDFCYMNFSLLYFYHYPISFELH